MISTTNYVCLVTLVVVSGLLLTVAAEVQTATTPASLIVSSTFQSISVKAPFSGDNNANNSALVQYRQAGTTPFLNAYTPFIDRRVTVGGAANPYFGQARISIVGLMPNTSYDVQVTWTDADGVTSQPAIVTISTLSYTPTLGGTTITVTNDATLASALGSVNPGQTIHINPGTYRPFTIGRSGNSGAWIKIEGDFGDGTIVTGTGVNQNILIAANFVIVSHLTLSASDSSGIVLSRRIHDVFVQDNTLENVSAQCASNPSGHYGDTGIFVAGAVSNVYVIRNQINSTALSSPSCKLSPIWNSPGTGIAWGNITTLVVQDNKVAGGFRDAISLDDNLIGENVDIVGNSVGGYRDDGAESKGGNVNVRIWSNRITADEADSCIAANSNDAKKNFGPIYIFRNTCRVTTSNSAGETVYKLPGSDIIYVFHNSVDTTTAPVHFDGYVCSGGTFKNNILRNNGSTINFCALSASTFDYNLYDWSGGGCCTFAYKWNGVTSYDSFNSFRSGAGQEAHGKAASVLFTDPELHINKTSPAFDAGVLIPNFNDPHSAWPYSGTAPDLGAYEVNTDATLPIRNAGVKEFE
jgi:hypothetical protein